MYSKYNYKNKRGATIAIVLCVILLLMVIGAGLLNLGFQGRIFAIRNASGISARCAADAGISEALLTMNNKLKIKPWDDSSLPSANEAVLPNFDATYSYNIVKDSNTIYTIRSTGKSGNIERTVNGVIRLKGIFDAAILVKEKLELGNSVLIDGFNSVDSSVADVDVYVGTASIADNSIIFGFSTLIDGNVFCGVNGNPKSVINGGKVTGSVFASEEEIIFRDIDAPVLIDTGTSINAAGKEILTNIDSGKYYGMFLDNQSSVEITGNVVLHIAGDITMGNGSEIVVKDGGSLTLYVDGNIDATNSVGMGNQTGDATKLQIYSTGTGQQIFNLKNQTEDFGMVYAPNADITLKNSSDVVGSIIANSFVMKNAGTFRYDENIRNTTLPEEAIKFVMKHWYE